MLMTFDRVKALMKRTEQYGWKLTMVQGNQKIPLNEYGTSGDILEDISFTQLDSEEEAWDQDVPGVVFEITCFRSKTSSGQGKSGPHRFTVSNMQPVQGLGGVQQQGGQGVFSQLAELKNLAGLFNPAGNSDQRMYDMMERSTTLAMREGTVNAKETYLKEKEERLDKEHAARMKALEKLEKKYQDIREASKEGLVEGFPNVFKMFGKDKEPAPATPLAGAEQAAQPQQQELPPAEKVIVRMADFLQEKVKDEQVMLRIEKSVKNLVMSITEPKTPQE